MPRSVWKGPFVDGYLLKKAEDARASGRKSVIKTWSRRSTILPQFVGLTFGVYNGQKFVPVLVTEDMIKKMQKGSVVVDVAIDQGGCFETSRPTTHADPTYVVDDVVHYCVTNMPGAVARTSARALNNATLPFVLELADKGYVQALKENPHLLNGLNIHKGHVTYEAVAHDLGLEYVQPSDALD